ncbi:MotA/TolQ/ExbB proton channel family protein [Marinobacter sp. CHS3-4]|uniref:MotA/TolQ/ExbB proton channel family protein n=1 Tax=Marinobacter sp. CHS3-4 TaxID=3045174 RepID=UPI0024B54FB6|nr:MotA/TolQ/ExbB proton channel family protein [Marinobacter sp. CHS3-4]MDI9243639.1 MotA/TolQ/ExbB proton channel family protein [Marinobacter sp. CHS3-4]
METVMPSSGALNGLIDQLIIMGGPVIAVLMIMAVIGVVAFVYLMLYGALFAPRHSAVLKRHLQLWQQQPDSTMAESLNKSTRGASRLNPLSHLVLAIMEGRLNRQPSARIQESVSQKAKGALAPFEAPLKIIEVIAALAPLLGLLGTVIGMMEAFSTMAAAEGRASASQLSGGIYQALTTTAAGLVVAIPFAAIAAWIEFRLGRLQATMNTVLFDTLNTPETADVERDSNARPLAAQVMGPQEATDMDWQGRQAVNAVR